MSDPQTNSSMKVPSATMNLKKAIFTFSNNCSYGPVTTQSFKFARWDGLWKKLCCRQLSTTAPSLMFDSLIL